MGRRPIIKSPPVEPRRDCGWPSVDAATNNQNRTGNGSYLSEGNLGTCARLAMCSERKATCRNFPRCVTAT